MKNIPAFEDILYYFVSKKLYYSMVINLKITAIYDDHENISILIAFVIIVIIILYYLNKNINISVQLQRYVLCIQNKICPVSSIIAVSGLDV